MSGSQLPWKAVGVQHAWIRPDDQSLLHVFVLYSRLDVDDCTHKKMECMSCQLVCILVECNPSGRLTCAVQLQRLKGFHSLSANPNKAQAEPEWGMSALLVTEGQPERECVNVSAERNTLCPFFLLCGCEREEENECWSNFIPNLPDCHV